MAQSIYRERERHCAFAADFTSRCSAAAVVVVAASFTYFSIRCFSRPIAGGGDAFIAPFVVWYHAVYVSSAPSVPLLSMSRRPMLYMLWCAPSDCQSYYAREVDTSLSKVQNVAADSSKWLLPDFAFPFLQLFYDLPDPRATMLGVLTYLKESRNLLFYRHNISNRNGLEIVSCSW